MKSYGLENYKLIEKEIFELNRINIVIGENSSGKSSFLRSFQLIKQSIPFTLEKLHTNFIDGIDFGTYSNLISNSDDKKLSFNFSFNTENKYEYGNFEVSELKISYQNNFLKEIGIFLNNGAHKLYLELNANKIEKIYFDKENLIASFEIENEAFLKYNEDTCLPHLMEIKVNEKALIREYLENSKNYDDDKEKNDILNFILDSLTEKIYINENLELVYKEHSKVVDKNLLLFDSVKKQETKKMVNKLLIETGKKLKRVFNNSMYIGQ